MMAEGTWVATLASHAIDGSANTRTYPPVSNDYTLKEVMATTGYPHQIYSSQIPGEEISANACLSSLASIITEVDGALRCDRAAAKDTVEIVPTPEKLLDRLV